MNLSIFKQIKRLFLPSLVFSLLLISCSEEKTLDSSEIPSIEKQKLTIKAPSLIRETKISTRITVDADRKDNEWTNSEPITWVKGDAFKVKFLGTGNSEVETFTLSSIDDNDAYFEGTPPGEGEYGVYAFYPASKATFDATAPNLGTEKTLDMFHEQTQIGNDYSHLGSTAYMYDKVATTANTGVYVNADGSLREDLILHFKHLTSLIRFHVTNETGTSIKVESIKMSFSGEGSQLYKTVKFDESTGVVTIDESASDNEYNELTLKIDESPSIPKNNSFDGYMSLFPTKGYDSTSAEEYYNFEVAYHTADDPSERFNVNIPIAVKDMHFGGDKYAKFEAGKRYVLLLYLEEIEENIGFGVLINEVYSSGPDWIELYNDSDEDIDISGFRLQDDKGAEEEYIIPEGTVITAKSYLVFEEYDFGFGLSSSNGDKVVLLDLNLAIVDQVILPPMVGNRSYGRVTDGAAEWIVFDRPTKGQDNSTEFEEEDVDPTLFEHIILNEICGEQKYVEIYNKGSEEVSLAGLILERNEGVSSYSFTSTDVIPAGAYRLILFNSHPLSLETNDAFVDWRVLSGISDQQTLSIQLITTNRAVISSFQRGTARWGDTEDVDRVRQYSYSRQDDGTWGYASYTPGAVNGTKVLDIINPGYTAQ